MNSPNTSPPKRRGRPPKVKEAPAPTPPPQGEMVVSIPLTELHPFPNHPFKVRDVPARISPAKTAEMKEAAQRIYKALGCQGFARVDMFLDKAGRVVFNEVNTVPGFTAHSRYPSMMKAVGMSFEQVISNVIELAVSG